MKIAYRPEIDGLRALAVFSVIIYHAKISFINSHFLTGGYIGVDIFFVISGYLITSIILTEFYSTNSFSIRGFYNRRARRILPALTVVILATITYGYFYLYPISLIGLSKSSISSLFFSSNIFFWQAGELYDAENSLMLPLLHTWSLSVEEQYYIIFPIIMLLIYKFFRNFTLVLFLGGFVSSFIMADYISKIEPSFNFYILPTRAWELLAGSIAAYLLINKENFIKKFKRYNLSNIGFVLILFSIIFFDDNTRTPSFVTVIPILGVFFIILFLDKNQFLFKLLSSKPLVFLGLISYSLYLWHYPIFSYSRIIEFYNGSMDKFLILLSICFVLSFLTYKFVERPFRNKNKSFKSVLTNVFILYIIIISFNVLSLENGFSNRIKNNNTLSKQIFFTNKEKEKVKNYNLIENQVGGEKIILIGDSVMRTLKFDLSKKLKDENLNFLTMTEGACQFILNLNRVNKKTFRKSDCNIELQNFRLRRIKENSPSIIVLGGRLPILLEETRFDNKEGGYEGTMQDFMQNKDNSLNTITQRNKEIQKQYRLTVETLLKEGNKVILVYPIPEVGWNVPKKIFNYFPKNIFSYNNYDSLPEDFLSTSYSIFLSRSKSSFDLLDSIVHNNVYRIYPHELFCNNYLKDRCISQADQKIFYSDSSHLSVEGAKLFNEILVKKILEISRN